MNSLQPTANRLPSPAAEAALFWRLRGRIGTTLVQQALQTARLRTVVIVLLTIVFWIGMLFVFLEGFRIMNGMIPHEGTRVETVHAIFNVFFLSLLCMLTVSSAILLYSGLYRSRETRYLLTNPVRPRRIVLFKFQETLLVSCWGFFLLGSPLMVAYGITASAPWYYYAAFFPFMLAFSFIPVSLGAMLCLLFVRYLPRLRFHIVGLLVFAGVLAVATLIWTLVREANSGNTMTFEWFQATLGRLQYSEQRWFPSWWLSSGLLETAHPADIKEQSSWKESLGFLSVLTSNAMILYLGLGRVADRHYVAGYSGLAELGSARRRATAGWIDRAILLMTAPFPRAMRLLLMKDLRVFRRDILQWSQFAIFFCLLTFYFLNARRVQYGGAAESWMTVVGFLNVAVVGLLLATFTTRFIYPLISLEGRRFWILGTLPIDRKDILWSKFLFAVGISVVPCAMLILLSDLMLLLHEQSPWVLVVHQWTCVWLCLGLCGIAVGMGARVPNLREASPAKIASGFGGTLTLVLSVAFIMACLACSAVPTCFWLSDERILASEGGDASWARHAVLGSWGAVVLGAMATGLLGVVTTVISLTAGLRAFQKLEP